ncbi:tetratricopeptide repeat protein [Candidatus Venteria ishoeyi]|nr:tetratricopeptide repeat protein [Candidatus Venteria ishoeyi]
MTELSQKAARMSAGQQQQLTQKAIHHARKAIKLEPGNADFLTTLGSIYRVANQYEEAEEAYRQALQYNPKEPIALDGLGQTLWHLAGKNQFQKEAAEIYFKQAIAENPNLEIAYFSLAKLSLELDDAEQAVFYGNQALAKHPGASIFATVGDAYQRLEKFVKAEQCYQQGIKKFPDHATCYKQYTDLAIEQGNLQQAKELSNKISTLTPDDPESLIILAKTHELAKEFTTAEAIYNGLINQSLRSEYYYYLAANQVKQGDKQAALESLAQGMAIELERQKDKTFLGIYLAQFTRNWTHFNHAVEVLKLLPPQLPSYQQAHAQQLVRTVLLRINGEHTKYPIHIENDITLYSSYLLDIHYSPEYTQEEVYTAHCEFDRLFAQPLALTSPPHRISSGTGQQLRIGYMSQDFRAHSVAYFIEPILSNHDPEKVAVFCYYNNTHQDAVTERFKGYCNGGWRDCMEWTDDELANIIRRDKIDILVDLMGHTGKNRILVFARKPAPVQMAYLGYSDTTGLTAIDYRLTDTYVEPEGAEQFSSEQLLRMPGSYFCYRPADITKDITVNPLPALSKNYITFGSFNAYNKITNTQIKHWAAILARVPDSRLLLKVRQSGDLLRNFKTIIRKRFAQYGIASERLIIKDYARSLEIALKIYHEVDICLDTYPYNGATTTCESLWMGCPVVSLYGQNHVSRMSLSILSAVGLAELAVDNAQVYIETAVTLAQDIDKLKNLRASMRERLQNSPLMDATGFTKELEQHYQDIWQTYIEASSSPQEQAIITFPL